MKDKIEKEEEYFNWLVEEEGRLLKLINESEILLEDRRYRIKTQKKYLFELKRPNTAIDCKWCNGTGDVETLIRFEGDSSCPICSGRGYN